MVRNKGRERVWCNRLAFPGTCVLLACWVCLMLMSACLCMGCAASTNTETSSDEDAITMADVTSEDLYAANGMMSQYLGTSAMSSMMFSGDAIAKEVTAEFQTNYDTSDARALVADAELLCDRFSLAVAQAAYKRVAEGDPETGEAPSEDELEAWQQLIDAEQLTVDEAEAAVENGDEVPAGALFDSFSFMGAIHTADTSIEGRLDGAREAGPDSPWVWQ